MQLFIKYAIEFNKNKVDISNVKLEDFILKGMKYLPDSLRICKYDNEGKFTWVTNELKGKVYQNNYKVIIDFGNIKDQYIIVLRLKSLKINIKIKQKLYMMIKV